jgi:AcrR family transcriptional regulator
VVTVAGEDDEVNGPRRPYDASARRERAAASRRRIVEAAADLFSQQGYGATTLEQIAASAGVTAKLVAANGPKRALLLAAFELRVGGVEGAGDDAARADAAPILAQPTATALVELLADVIVAQQQRNIGLWRALAAAAAEHPEVADVYAAVEAGRRRVFRLAVDMLAERGVLLPGDPDEQAATLALVMGFEPYQLMVLDWGWSPQRLRAWTVRTLHATLVDPSA